MYTATVSLPVILKVHQLVVDLEKRFPGEREAIASACEEFARRFSVEDPRSITEGVKPSNPLPLVSIPPLRFWYQIDDQKREVLAVWVEYDRSDQ